MTSPQPGNQDERAWACDGCGDRLPSQHVCIAPTGEHTWRPLPAPSAGQDTERPAIDEDSCAWCDLPSLGYADSSAGILPSCGSDGHGFDGTWYPAPDLVRQFIAERDDFRRELDQARAQVQRVREFIGDLDEDSRNAKQFADEARARDDREMQRINIRHARVAHHAAEELRRALGLT